MRSLIVAIMLAFAVALSFASPALAGSATGHGVTVTSDVNPSIVGQTVTFTVTGLTGNVQYIAAIGGVETALVPDANGTATFSWTFDGPAGGYTVYIGSWRTVGGGQRKLTIYATYVQNVE